ncbi:hypothetical protein [Candidatus Harpocratesius sp.]
MSKPKQKNQGAVLEDDLEIHKNLAKYVENFDNFQSGKDDKKEKIAKQKRRTNLLIYSAEELKHLRKQDLVKLVFQVNCQFVDRFFRKDYFSKLIKLSKEELEKMALHLNQHTNLLLL